jgi:uncharacterized protein YlxW (UPF0749 family)
MPSDVVTSSRPPLSLLLGIALLGWGVAGYAFYSTGGTRDGISAKLAQTEAARATLATELEQQRATAGQADDLRKQLAAAQAELTQAQAATAEATQRVTGLTAELAARTKERDSVAARLDAAQAAAGQARAAAAAAGQKTPVHK